MSIPSWPPASHLVWLEQPSEPWMLPPTDIHIYIQSYIQSHWVHVALIGMAIELESCITAGCSCLADLRRALDVCLWSTAKFICTDITLQRVYMPDDMMVHALFCMCTAEYPKQRQCE